MCVVAECVVLCVVLCVWCCVYGVVCGVVCVVLCVWCCVSNGRLAYDLPSTHIDITHQPCLSDTHKRSCLMYT